MLTRDLFKKLLRFGIVGIIVMVAFMGMNAGLSRYLGIGKMAAFFLAYPPALCLHFLLNKRWTFESKAAASRKQVGEYLVMVATTLVIQWIVFAAVTARWPLVPGWLGAGAANAAQMAVSFLAMQRRVFAQRQQQASPPPEGTVVLGLGYPLVIATAAIFVAACSFYGWSLDPEVKAFALAASSPDYYARLARGLIQGHLYMDVALPAHLPRFEKGVLPEGVPFLLDASFYRGHYYLYFGVAPALVLFLPVRLLFGADLPQRLAILILCAAGFAFLIAAAAEVRRRWFPRSSGLAWIAAVLLLGFGTMVPAVVRRGEFYEVAATGAFCFWAGMMWCLVRAAVGNASGSWLAAASAFAGCAIGSRPEVALGAVLVLPVSALWFWAREGGKRSSGGVLRLLLAGGIPSACVIAGLAWYNYARFGDPAEFGHTYQVGSAQAGFASARYFWHNLRIYYLAPPVWSWYFPYVSPAIEGSRPSGYFGVENAHGEWIFLPFVALIGIPMAVAGLGRFRKHGLTLVCLALGLWFLGNLACLCCIGVRSNRYMLGFHPALALGSAVAVIALGEARGLRGRLVAGASILWALAAVAFNLGASFETQRFFRDFYPESFERVAALCNRLAWPLQSVLGEAPGRQRVAITFPTGVPGKIENILTTGSMNFSDELDLVYDSETTARFILFHSNMGSIEGEPFTFVPGRRYVADLSLGMLYPPFGHPWYGSLADGAQRWLKAHNTISLDGKRAFEGDAPSVDGQVGRKDWGKARPLDLATNGFSGSIEAMGPLPLDREVLEQHRLANGPVRLRVRFPADHEGLVDPLLTVGNYKNFNIIRVRYLDSRHIVFGLDGQGSGVVESEPVALDYAVDHTVEIFMDSLEADPEIQRDDALGRVTVHFDGQLVLSQRQLLAHISNYEVLIGARNWFGNSTRMIFGGRILSSERRAVLRSEIADSLRSHGAVEVGLRLPSGRWGVTEPIVSRGSAAEGECVFVRYESARSIVFGYDHRGFGAVYSEPIPVDYGTDHHLEICLGALLPEGDFGRRRLRLLLDGQEVLDAPVVFVADKKAPVRIGRNDGLSSACTPQFTGIFTSLSWKESIAPSRILGMAAPMELTLQLPQGRTGASEPLLEAGVTGAADSIYVIYSSPTSVRFGLDRWGIESRLTGPVSVDYSKPVRLRISYGPVFPANDTRSNRILIVCDGRTVMDERLEFSGAASSRRFIGANPLQMSTSGPEFTGKILAVEAVR